jgi:Flp pilus assembly protein TadD
MLLRSLAIIALGFIAYGAMLHTPFRVMDDRISIVENQAIKSFNNVPSLFREGYFHDQSYYRPLVNLSFMAEYRAFGLNSFFYNLDNLILHILNAFLVFLLVSRLTHNVTIGFWTALLFVVHPVQWEAVCNVPGRSILLSAFFELSAFIAFLEFNKGRGWFYLPVVLGAFFSGLLCKESAGVLPLVVMAYLAFDDTRPWTQKLKGLWPFLVGIAAYLCLRQYFGITQLHRSSEPKVMVLGFVTFLRSVITDLRLFLLPVDLHYDRCLPFLMSLRQPQALMTCLFWGAVLIVLVLVRRHIRHFFIFLMLWFAIELLPVSQLVTSIGVGAGHVSTAEHFLYLACIPVFIGMVLFFQWLQRLNVVRPVVLKLLAGGFLSFLLLMAVEQSIYASNEFNMIHRSLGFEPDNPRLQSAMAMLSVFRNDIPDAEKHFRLAIKAEPLNATYHIGLGTALCQQGRWIEGLEQFVAFDPGKDKALVERQENLAMMQIRKQLNQGKIFDAKGWLAIGIFDAQTARTGQAIEAFTKTTLLNPSQPDAWFNLGSLYEAQHNWTQARRAYQKLLTLPDASFFQRDFVTKHLANMDNKG